WFFFFFQAEDGIRDWSVTGVQTCALPISGGAGLLRQAGRPRGLPVAPRRAAPAPGQRPRGACAAGRGRPVGAQAARRAAARRGQIGRASCRERGEEWGGGGGGKGKKGKRT